MNMIWLYSLFVIFFYLREHEEKISEEKNKCKKAPWYKKYICIASGAEITYHGVIIAGLWVAHEAALGVLEAARLFLKAAQAVIKVIIHNCPQLPNIILHYPTLSNTVQHDVSGIRVFLMFF